MSVLALFAFEEDFFFLFVVFLILFRSPGNVVTFRSKLEPVSFVLFRAACLRFLPSRISETKLVPLFKTSFPMDLAPRFTRGKTDRPKEAKMFPNPYPSCLCEPEKYPFPVWER